MEPSEMTEWIKALQPVINIVLTIFGIKLLPDGLIKQPDSMRKLPMIGSDRGVDEDK